MLSYIFLLIYSNSKKAKTMQISKGLISHNIDNSLPSQLYDLKSTQIIII